MSPKWVPIRFSSSILECCMRQPLGNLGVPDLRKTQCVWMQKCSTECDRPVPLSIRGA
jgi:hypothetical protein